jgi:hypothetical protein
VTTATRRNHPRAVDEIAALVLPVVRAVVRYLPEILAGLAVLSTVLAGLALAGAVIDDRKIDANPAVAEADVLRGSSFSRTLVLFTVANGEAVVPDHGVFYPRGLEDGQKIAVEYDVTKPSLVRVAGRSAVDGVIPLGLGVVVTWAVLGPLTVWLWRRRSAS